MSKIIYLLIMDKVALRNKFSSEYAKYYQVHLFEKEGFIRKKCSNCNNNFWTADNSRLTCPEQPCEQYGFIGNSPSMKKLDYAESWMAIEKYFVNNGHTSVSRYPVVARWRPDLYFTIASIVDFQRIEGGKVSFEFPENPLIVPQMCLRFNDIENVGISGKHFTSFVMIGQHCVANNTGYWKDKCIELDYGLLTQVFGIPKKEIVFKEDVWIGYGAFGYSLEYFVRGLELGNAVFTEFEGTPDNYKPMNEKIIDMGAGLERFTWLTQGTPTAYEAVFGPVVDKVLNKCNIVYEKDFFLDYSKISGVLNLDEAKDINVVRTAVAKQLNITKSDLITKITPLESMFALIDHVKTLIFAISDGALPSNVGGGYNLRVLLRRALSKIDSQNWNITLGEVADWHISYLSKIYPELRSHRDEIITILEVEEKRYRNTQIRIKKLVGNIQKDGKTLTEDNLIKLYDSDGITPEFLKDQGVSIDIPPNFYAKVTERHITHTTEKSKRTFDIDNLPSTRPLFYEDQELVEFDAKVLTVFKESNYSFIVLDKTAFYARAGGQEPDTGVIHNHNVLDVEKYGHVILHKIDTLDITEGMIVHGKIDANRRRILTSHHTATHVMLGAAKRALGSWIWQASAFKDIHKARLDITHFEHLSLKQIETIEKLANSAIRKNLPVHKLVLDRGEAEKKYGFSIYQGGIAPGKSIRVQDIEGWDVEACAGTHVLNTGEIGLIKIIKNERVQDGVERLEYVAGETALDYIQQQNALLDSISAELSVQTHKIPIAIKQLIIENELIKKNTKSLLKNHLADIVYNHIIKTSTMIKDIPVTIIDWDEVDEDFHILIGENCIKKSDSLIYIGLINKNNRSKFVIFCGDKTSSKFQAVDLIHLIATEFGGSGGGNKRFAQGGGSQIGDVQIILDKLNSLIQNS
ncbi:MAG: alanine--tRNA ligase [Thaumarchaeota archaeon]|nr:alanine--tRNA ligase [Nitrososphaerota archaeon]